MSKAGVSKRGNTDAIVEVKKRRNVRKTTHDYIKEVSEIAHKEYVVLGEYVNREIPVRHRHILCSYEWDVAPGSFLKGTRCPKCAKVARKTSQGYAEELSIKHCGEYAVVGDYINCSTAIVHVHVSCGHEWLVRPDCILRGKGCPKCADTTRTTTEYLSELEQLCGNDYSIIGEYINARSRITHRHNLCGYEWLTSPYNFMRGSRCPRCPRLKMSKGERGIAQFLSRVGLTFEREYRTEHCKAKRPLPFDFAVLDESGKLLTLIEFDGQQHFIPLEIFGGAEKYKLRQHCDRIKTEYCRANDIPLIRIDYTQFDEIETILTEKLTKLGVIGNRPTAKESAREEVSVC